MKAGVAKMKVTDIIGICGLLVAILTGAYSVGVLKGRIDALEPEKIGDAREDALRVIDARLAAFEMSRDTVAFEWSNGQQPVEMIAVNDGICYLTLITGFFENMGEDVAKIFILGDYWHLGGSTSRFGTGAEARCWRFPKWSTDSP